MGRTSLPAIEALLTGGGDARLALNSRGANKYGCFAVPQPDILAYGSCTASTISRSGFAAATQLYRRLEYTSYADELNRIRRELAEFCGLAAGTDIIFGTSGTDLHLFAVQLLGRTDASLLVIMPEASETGSGVPAALRGEAMDHAPDIEVAALESRSSDGGLRSPALVDAEVEALVVKAVAEGKRVLLVLTDLSKTGLTIPSPACALALKRRFADRVDVLVDACQFRLSPATLRAYLEQDVLLAMTGSKFVTGPAFSAALLAPQAVAQRLRDCMVPPALGRYSARADWPEGWAARSSLPDVANDGLLLRWEAALAECRAFYALPETTIRAFVARFAAAVQKRLSDDAGFEPLPVGEINRQPLAQHESWDQLQTIFPFRMRHPKSGALLNKDDITKIYETLTARRCQLGQPVTCGALRLCLDMRLIVDALSPDGRSGDEVIADAMRVLDEARSL